MKRMITAAVAALSFFTATAAQADNGLVKSVLFCHQTALSGGQPSDTVAFFTPKDSIFLCSLNQRTQSVEVDHNLWKSKVLGDNGGLAVWSADARHFDVGLIQCYRLKVLGGTFTGFAEALRSNGSHDLYWSSPNNRILWSLDKENRWSAGIGLAYSGGQHAPDKLHIGPAVQLATKIADKLNIIRLRVTTEVEGPHRGNIQARLDWVVIR